MLNVFYLPKKIVILRVKKITLYQHQRGNRPLLKFLQISLLTYPAQRPSCLGRPSCAAGTRRGWRGEFCWTGRLPGQTLANDFYFLRIFVTNNKIVAYTHNLKKVSVFRTQGGSSCTWRGAPAACPLWSGQFKSKRLSWPENIIGNQTIRYRAPGEQGCRGRCRFSPIRTGASCSPILNRSEIVTNARSVSRIEHGDKNIKSSFEIQNG